LFYNNESKEEILKNRGEVGERRGREGGREISTIPSRVS
jgi:hypothetical protein